MVMVVPAFWRDDLLEMCENQHNAWQNAWMQHPHISSLDFRGVLIFRQLNTHGPATSGEIRLEYEMRTSCCHGWWCNWLWLRRHWSDYALKRLMCSMLEHASFIQRVVTAIVSDKSGVRSCEQFVDEGPSIFGTRLFCLSNFFFLETALPRIGINQNKFMEVNKK